MIEERIEKSIQFGVDAMKAHANAGFPEGPDEEGVKSMARFVTNDYNVTFKDYMDWIAAK